MGQRHPGGYGWNLNNYFGRANKIYNEKPVHGPGFKDTSGKHLPPGVRIPDWKVCKVETAPELLEVQQKLAALGLKDPWLRNNVWRLDRRIWGTPADRQLYLLRSFKFGVLAFLVSYVYHEYIESKDHHHHPVDKWPLLYELEGNNKHSSGHGHH